MELAGNVLSPSFLMLIFFIFGLILFTIRRFRKTALRLFMISAGIYFIAGNGIISLWLLGTLERQYAPLASTAEIRDVKAVVVLSGYAERRQGLPLSSEVNFASAYRLMEALRIAQLLPGSKMLISGWDAVPGIMKELLVAMGLSPQYVEIENESKSTRESAVNLKALIGEQKFILITSAGHMPRAMAAFRKAGMNPVPAPTNYMSIKERRYVDYLPLPQHIVYADLAVHEYLGMAWYRLIGGI